MRNGKPTLRKLRRLMLKRFDGLEADLDRVKRSVGKLRSDVRLLFDFVGELDHELKLHQRDPRAHQ